MKLIIPIGVLILLINLTVADVSSIVSSSTESNSNEDSTAATTPILITSKLRKALLEALHNYQNDDDDEQSSTTTDSVEETSTATTPIITVHSFAAEADDDDDDETREDNSGSNEIIRTIVIQKPRSTLQPPKEPETNNLNNKADGRRSNRAEDTAVGENIQISNIQFPKSEIDSKIKPEKSKKKAFEKLEKAGKATLTTTTTTVPPPVTNADGENIEKTKEINIEQAPLLSAFTVLQDENGTPKQIVPLFKILNRNKATQAPFRPSQPIPASIPISTSSTTQFVSTTHPTKPSVTASQPNQQQQFDRQSIEQKQRELEQQILALQAKQREYEELIRRNQFLEQQRIRNEADERQRQEQLIRQRQQLQEQQTPPLPPQQSRPVQFQIIPSVSHSIGVSVEQQLPFKQPAEFHPEDPNLQRPRVQNPFNQQQPFRQSQKPIAGALVQQPTGTQIQQQNIQQISLPPQLQQNLQLPVRGFEGFNPITNVSPLSTSLELPVRNFQQFNNVPDVSALPTSLELPQKNFQTFNSAPLQILPSITESVPAGQSRNRVFRNDAGQTGNFGFNGRQNFNQPQFQSVAFDNQIQNFLLQSGISQRSAEDFKIISKVLALNHGVPDAFTRNDGRF